MAFNEIEIARIKKEVGSYIDGKRPPAYMRNELDIAYRVDNQSIIIYEIRPVWRNPDEKIEMSVIKFTFVRSQAIWKVYWLRQDLKWHEYEPYPTAKTIKEILNVLEEDAYGCFWG